MKSTFTLNQLIAELEMYCLIIENHFLPVCRNIDIKD